MKIKKTALVTLIMMLIASLTMPMTVYAAYDVYPPDKITPSACSNGNESNEERNYDLPENILEPGADLFWHSQWENGKEEIHAINDGINESKFVLPAEFDKMEGHWLLLELADVATIAQVNWLPAQNAAAGTFADVEFFYGTDGLNFKHAGTAAGYDWNDPAEQSYELPAPVEAKFILLFITSGKDGYACCGEVTLYTTAAPTAVTPADTAVNDEPEVTVPADQTTSASESVPATAPQTGDAEVAALITMIVLSMAVVIAAVRSRKEKTLH